MRKESDARNTSIRIMPVIILLVLALGLLPGGCQAINQNALITEVLPNLDTAISAWGWVGVTFSQAMDRPTAEDAFSIIPAVDGVFTWEENTLWFRPLQALDPAITYACQLVGQLTSLEGKTLDVDHAWKFSIRQPELLFLRDGEIWRVSQEGTNPQPITQTDGAVLEFSPERSGEWVAFTVQNELGGQDIWVTSRDGEQTQALVNCGQDGCSELAWSPDRNWIAYTRDVQILGTGGYQASQVWMLNQGTKETTPLYQKEIISSHSPSFSPDGQKLASYDTTHQVIRVLDLQSYQETIIPSSIPGTGDWSQDGQKIIFTDLLSAQLEPFVMVYVADVKTGVITSAFNQEVTDTNFSQPRWLPGGEWIATSLRPVNTSANKALWLIRLKDGFAIPISNDFSAIFSAYQWDPWGDRLVYQRLQLSNSEAPTSIWFWDWEDRLAQQIIQDGSRPAWLP